MLTANLLPPQEKKLLKREMSRRLIKFFAGGITIVLTFGSILILPSFFALYFQERELERSFLFEKEASESLGIPKTIADFRKFDVLLDSLASFAGGASRASDILDEMIKSAGPGVAVTSLTVRKGGEVTMLGVARGRSDLLNFEKNLRDSGRFQNISSPLSNIVRENNINFTLQGTLKSAASL